MSGSSFSLTASVEMSPLNGESHPLADEFNFSNGVMSKMEQNKLTVMLFFWINLFKNSLMFILLLSLCKAARKLVAVNCWLRKRTENSFQNRKHSTLTVDYGKFLPQNFKIYHTSW